MYTVRYLPNGERMGGQSPLHASLELAQVLHELGVPSDTDVARQVEPRADLVLVVSGHEVPVEVKARATVTPAQVAALTSTAADAATVGTVVVADRVTEKAREMLRAASIGWFDRRGHLRVVAPGILIDTDVRVPAVNDGETRDPLRRRAVLEVATWLMSDPARSPAGVRELARILSRSPSSISDALADLRSEGLITKTGQPTLPDLFWETADHWSTARQPLASEPNLGAASLTDPLQLGFDAVERGSGWALTDTFAAAAYGAPVGVRAGAPPDFLVPTKQLVRLAAITLGIATEADRRCSVREAPVAWACDRRVDGAKLGLSARWPLAHPLFVALDLASDPGRGREILESWTPKEPWRRVW